ncbi:MAG: hypothetical protein RIR94_172 [Bacteroidota bacterium]
MKFFFLLGVTLLTQALQAQIRGVVQGADSVQTKPLKNVKITLLGVGTTVFSNEDGTFEILMGKQQPDTLLFVAKGYRSDRLVVTRSDRFLALNVVLVSGQLVQDIVVSSQKNPHGISKMKTLHVEELTSAEFRKAACCNLSESFETNATVDVSMSDAISGAKKIQLLGLDAVYTQLQFENIPFLRGLESAYGMSVIPGTWLESIQITKGTGSVVNGYESMAGLVNLEFKKPKEMPRLGLNVYQNRFGRTELNLQGGQQLSERWHMGLFASGAAVYGAFDQNQDSFRDQALSNTFNLLQRLSYQGPRMEAQLGVQAYTDQKIGGQTSYTKASPVGYGMQLASEHLSVFAKTGFFGKKPAQSLGVIAQFKLQNMSGLYGMRNFSGHEKRGYLNVIYDDIIGSADHKIKAGASLLALQIEQFAAQPNGEMLIVNLRTEWVPGVFAEYAYSGNRLSAVIGARFDQHNLAGAQFSPRAHLKYALSPQLDLRLTGGRAWRLPNFVMDNLSLLASSNTWIANQALLPEISWNVGASLVQGFSFKKRKGSLSLDAYHTRFSQQLVADRDTLSGMVVFKNLSANSVATVLQAEFAYALLRGLDLRLAYKFQDVRALYNGKLQTQVLLPRQRLFANIGYQTRNKRWAYDLTYSRYSAVRLPQGGQGQAWGLLNAQVTRNWKQLELYVGGENLLNVMQQHPIVSAQNPFGPDFDATEIWSPIMGWNVYLGLRYTIK